jgi:hypothetical protein
MRINQHIDRYDFLDLEEIYRAAQQLQRHGDQLEAVGLYLRNNIDSYSTEFTSINYERIKEASERFIDAARRIREEAEELVGSTRQLAEKFGRIFA